MTRPATNCSSNCSAPAGSAPTRRVVKRKMSNYAVKRAEHRNPPRREPTITVLAA